MKAHIGPYRKNRKIEVTVHNHDLWSMDHTMAILLLPLFEKFRAQPNRGIPSVMFPDMNDDSEESWLKGEKDWMDILDKIIWSLKEIKEDLPYKSACPFEFTFEKNENKELVMKDLPGSEEELNNWRKNLKIYEDRLQEGLDLLGKYFQNFWC